MAGASCGCASSAPSSARGRSCCRPRTSTRTRRWRRSGRRHGRRRRPTSSRELIDQPRHLHPLLRDQRTIAGIGRSWVDEILWTAACRRSRKGSELDADEVERLRAASGERLGAALDHYEQVVGDDGARQGADAARGPPPAGRAVPALRHYARGDPLQGLRHVLLPAGADRRSRAQGPPAVAAAEVAAPPARADSRPHARRP